MKKTVLYLATAISMLFLFVSCDLMSELQSGSSRLTFKAAVIGKNTTSNDTVVFSGKNIKWFIGTTSEVVFADSATIFKLDKYRRIKCYLENDSLFSFTITSDVMSSIVNDLVLNHNLYDGKFYFEDGYPGWIDNIGATTLRAQNKEKRATAWAKFIAQLKLEGRYKE